MTHWLCVTNEENWKVAEDRKVWGVREEDRVKLERTNVHDSLVFYTKQKKKDDEIITPQIKGIFKITSAPFLSKERIFAGAETDELFPWRIRIEPIVLPKKPLEFKNLIRKLRFITNKEKWFRHLQIAMRYLPEEDFNLIRSEMKR